MSAAAAEAEEEGRGEVYGRPQRRTGVPGVCHTHRGHVSEPLQGHLAHVVLVAAPVQRAAHGVGDVSAVADRQRHLSGDGRTSRVSGLKRRRARPVSGRGALRGRTPGACRANDTTGDGVRQKTDKRRQTADSTPNYKPRRRTRMPLLRKITSASSLADHSSVQKNNRKILKCNRYQLLNKIKSGATAKATKT